MYFYFLVVSLPLSPSFSFFLLSSFPYDACEDNDELTETVSSYITFCVDLVIPSKTVFTYPNNKPRVTKELKSVINRKKRVFYSGDPLEIKAVSKEVKVEIRKAKLKYRNKIENQFSGGDLRAAWSGIKAMASINQPTLTKNLVTVSGVNDMDLADVFNSFFSHWERTDFLSNITIMRESLVNHPALVVAQETVTTLFSKVNIRKAAGPDLICGRTLRHCAVQLSVVFTKLFQWCADSGHIPSIWKTSTIIPVPKSNRPRDLNDFRPVALTSLVMMN